MMDETTPLPPQPGLEHPSEPWQDHAQPQPGLDNESGLVARAGIPRDPDDPGQWSDAGLEPAMKVHLQARIDQCFDREAIRAVSAEWL